MPVSKTSPLPIPSMRHRLGTGFRHERFRLVGSKLGILLIPRLPDVKPPCLTRRALGPGVFLFTGRAAWCPCICRSTRKAATRPASRPAWDWCRRSASMPSVPVGFLACCSRFPRQGRDGRSAGAGRSGIRAPGPPARARKSPPNVGRCAADFLGALPID